MELQRTSGWTAAGALVTALLLGLTVLSPAGAAEAAGITDACPAAHVVDGHFADVAPDSVHAGAVDCAAWWGIALGTGGDRFDPAGTVRRGQMASFVARLYRGSGGALPASPADAFADDTGSVHHYSTNRLAAVEVVLGRADATFGPSAPVTRGQMVSFLVRGLERRTGESLPAGTDAFADDTGSVHEAAIDAAAAAGLARGVAPGRFDPNAPVTRAQAASFLVRGLEALVADGHVLDSPATLRQASALRGFGSCEELLAHYKEEALQLVGPYGLGTDRFGLPVPEPGPVPVPVDQPTDDGAPAPEPAPGDPEAPADPGTDFSDTNVQEEGVDEADLVKTDGEQLLTVEGGRLHRVDVTGGGPAATGTLDLGGFAGELLLHGDRALVLAHEYRERPGERYVAGGTLTLVDVAAGAPMAVAGSLELDGSPVSARMVDGVARVVLQSRPDLPFVYPDFSEPDAEAEATRRNREIIEASTIADWLPGYRRTDATGAVTDEDALLDCSSIARPPEFSGLDLLTVLTVDLAEDFTPETSAAVLATGQTVYASRTGLYVATTRWDFVTGASPDGETTTEVHAFDISDPAAATYTASGKVEGFTLNQFALSEHDGHLRVATTSERWGEDPGSESRVVVLQAQDSELVEVGRVTGLGLGERIQAVRFLGDVGYVVTYRQVDPLYTIDLSDPTAPAVLGELKILGYSAYLHPIGDGLLLGVGVDADEEGFRQGTQVSLFDVSDPADPVRLHNATIAGGSSEVEFDHRAFLWWAPLDRLVVPLSVFDFDPETDTADSFVGAVGFDVDVEGGIVEAGRVTHADADAEPWSAPQIRRSLVVGDALYTLSARGVKASDLETLADRAWLPLD